MRTLKQRNAFSDIVIGFAKTHWESFWEFQKEWNKTHDFSVWVSQGRGFSPMAWKPQYTQYPVMLAFWRKFHDVDLPVGICHPVKLDAGQPPVWRGGSSRGEPRTYSAWADGCELYFVTVTPPGYSPFASGFNRSEEKRGYLGFMD